ncbi:MAG: hypothetical protein ACJ75R_02485 [Solirubrobacterales bacterium]
MKRLMIVIAVAAGMAFAAAPAWAATESLVTRFPPSPTTPFPQNKQNEPGLAINPTDHGIVAAGANDEVDVAPCDGSDCPFTDGVGNSGIYFSFDGGVTWNQPTYTGWSARDGSPGPGPIGTLPHYYENGLVSDGDPVLAWGPRPTANGGFDYDRGARLYYANLASKFPGSTAFKGFEAIAVSHTDNPAAASAGNAGAWSDPAVVTQSKQSSTTFSDKEAVWADNAESSDHFGNVYVCYTHFRSNGSEPEPIDFTRSTDGGDTWSKPFHLSPAYNSNAQPGRQGCAVRTDSDGRVYVVWEDTVKHHSVLRMAQSTDGGKTFGKPEVVASITDVGQFDGVRSISFDGIAGARTSSFPGFDIANGAPSGNNAPDTLALGWSDGSNGLNHEQALVQLSGNHGDDWSDPTPVQEGNDRPDFAFIGISPNGEDLYTVYDAFLAPFQDNTDQPRPFQGVLRHSDVDGTDLGATTTLHRGAEGDARASSANALLDEFIGDYNTVGATNGGAVAVWNDARDAAVCPAINTFRQDVVTSGGAGEIGEVDERNEEPRQEGDAPAPATDCPPTFGNTDIWAGVAADPTP